MATINLGRIKPVWQGAWSSSTAYVTDDIVYYNNSAWIAQASNTNSTPANNNANWEIMSQGFQIPTQTGNSGKALVTDGSSLSWGTVTTTDASLLTSGTLAKPRLPTGSVLQVVTNSNSAQYAFNGDWHSVSGINATITPTSASNKILVLIQLGRIGFYANNTLAFRITRNGNIATSLVGDQVGSRQRVSWTQMRVTSDNNHCWNTHYSGLDSPSTTSTLTYQLQAQQEGLATWYLNRNGSGSDSGDGYNSTGHSSITLMEIAG